MEKRKVYICDLSYTSHGVVSELVPYGIGCLKSYFCAHSKNSNKYEVKLFKYPEIFTEAVLKDPPDIVGLSNYQWNSNLSYTMADEVKRRFPETLVIFGGPNLPIDDYLCEKWLKDRPAIDIHVIGEGEQAFQGIIDAWDRFKDIQKVKEAKIGSCYSIIDGKLFKSGILPRLKDLDEYPSPYTMGYLDEFLQQEKIIPISQTNRGCPFTCTYCAKGWKLWTQITTRSTELFEEELVYIAQRCSGKVFILTDNNFGIFPKDIEFSKVLKRVKDKYDYPYQGITGTIKGAEGKKIQDRVLKCAELLEGTMKVTLSVQALDPEVLHNIKRKNIPLTQLKKIAGFFHELGSGTRSELLLALPGDTKKKHIDATLALMDADMEFVLPYTLILLHGSELATKENRQKWDFQTKFRLNHRCYGKTMFGDRELISAEIEEVIVGLENMSFEDYLQCRTMALTTSVFYSDNISREILNLLNSYGVKSSELVLRVYEKQDQYFTEGIRELYKSFNDATKNELWDDKDQLAKYVESGNITEGDPKFVGYNILFRHRAIAMIELTEDIITAAFNAARDILEEREIQYNHDYLSELETYCILRKRNMFDYNQEHTHFFNYDFLELADVCNSNIPQKLPVPKAITFYHVDAQKDLLQGFDEGVRGIMRIIPKVRLSEIFRSMKASVSEVDNDLVRSSS